MAVNLKQNGLSTSNIDLKNKTYKNLLIHLNSYNILLMVIQNLPPGFGEDLE